MPYVRAAASARSALEPVLASIRAEHEVPGQFPAQVLAEAESAAASPDLSGHEPLDLPFVTLDPEGSRDLDQAFHLSRRPSGGVTVRYAIADLAAFVDPHGAVAAEAWARVLTLYCPDRRVPLHPPVLSEQAASLWPDGERPAAVWTIEVDAAGVTASVDVRRALVRSRARLDYAAVQRDLDAGTAPEMLTLLPEVGALLAQAQVERGGSTLPLPEQEVREHNGRYRLEYRSPLPVEEWNAQLSLLTGRAAASLMLDAGVGVLRTMPPADERDVRRLRRAAAALGLDWPDDVPYGRMLATLPPASVPRVAAFLTEAAELYRGAAYRVLTDGVPAGDESEHAAIGAPYTHCTAPIRRLVDRFTTEVCLAVVADRSVPEWVLQALPELPRRMAEGSRRAAAVERAALDAVEWAVLQPYAREPLRAVVIDVRDETRGEVAVLEHAVIAPCRGRLTLGQRLWVRAEPSENGEHRVRFVRDDPP